jgi:hypothetical protein
MPNPENSNFDALADAIVQRLSQRSPGGLRPIGVPTPGIPGSGGPFGEIDPERPNLPFDGPHNSGADALPRARLGIAGMELTQSIQYSGAAGTTFGDDNSVPLVALKTLVARVYPVAHAGLFSDSLTGSRVTGELILTRGDRVAYRTDPTRAEGARVGPQQSLDRTLWDEDFSGLVPSSSLAALRRFVLNSSLNFIVPAYYCRGSRTTISVRLWRADDGPMSSYHATTSSVVTFLAVPAPRVSLVRVNWTDGAGNVTKPSDASMLATTSLAERMLPFPYLETTILGLEENRSGAFAAPSAASGGCNLAWQSLLSSLAVTKIFTALFGLGDIVFGIVPNAVVPAAGGSVNSGCSIGSAGCIIGFNTSFAHELGHQYGRPHVAVAGDASSDANYPNYGGDTKSIGEVGIDTGTSPPTLFDPATSDDLMSYGQNQWISPYTYQKILDGWDSHAFVSADPQHVRSILVVGIRLHRGVRDTRRVEIRQAHLVSAAGPPPKHIGATMSPLSIDLLDGSGKILATHHCFYVPAHGGSCGCGCSAEMVSPEREPYLEMHEAIELPGDEVAALSFHRGGEPFARLEAGGAPRVEIAGPERRDGSLAVQLQTQAPSRLRIPVTVVHPHPSRLSCCSAAMTERPGSQSPSIRPTARCRSMPIACPAENAAASVPSPPPGCARPMPIPSLSSWHLAAASCTSIYLAIAAASNRGRWRSAPLSTAAVAAHPHRRKYVGPPASTGNSASAANSLRSWARAATKSPPPRPMASAARSPNAALSSLAVTGGPPSGSSQFTPRGPPK